MLSDKPPRLAPPPEIILLDEISTRLAELTKLQMSMIPEGYIYQQTFNVTDKTTVIDFMKSYPYKPLFSIDVYNNGDKEVYFALNEQPRIKIPPKKTFTFEMKTAKVSKIMLECNRGENSTVIVTGVW